eukprot:g13724.t1
MNFMEGHFPEFHRHHDAAELKRWWSSSEPRILVVGPSSSSLAAKAKDFMPVFRLAHVWEEFFDIASADAQVMVEVLGSDFAFERGKTWALVLRSSSGAITKEHAPVATVRNYQQLCGDKALSQGTSKTYCLILVDASTEDTVKALRELESSQKAYYQEVQELRNTGEDSEERADLRGRPEKRQCGTIQPIRVASSSSRLPWKPAAPGPSFASIWAEASEARVFVLEMETRKFAAVKTPSLNEIFQNIAYEDLKLEDLHDEGPLDRSQHFFEFYKDHIALEPQTKGEIGRFGEASQKGREVSAFLSTSRGAICAYVLVALVVSVAPELELLQLAVPMVILVLVMMLASPTLFRKVIRSSTAFQD